MFREKMDGSNPSGMDIRVLFPAPTFCLKTTKVNSINGKTLKISLVSENRRKIQNAWPKYANNKIVFENKVKNRNHYRHCSHFIVIYKKSLVFTL